MNSRYFNILVPIISVLLGLLIGGIVMLASGYNPIDGFKALWMGAFGDAYYIGETIRQVIPYILTGLAVAFAFRTGLFNIGAEGQVIVGWLAAVWVGISFELPMIIHLPLAVLVAALSGALSGFIQGILNARLGVHEVIVPIMLHYTALHISNSVVLHVLSDTQNLTENIKPTASLSADWISDLAGNSRAHYGLLIAI